MEKEKEYEVTTGYVYDANNPVDAGKQFIDNLMYSGLYLRVKDLETGEVTLVDSETWSIE